MQPWLFVPGDWRRPDVQETYSAVRCPSCGYGQLYPRPTPEQIAAYYDVTEYYTHRRSPGHSPSKAFLERVRTHLAWRRDKSSTLDDATVQQHVRKTPSRVIELGCGNGGLTLSVQAHGHECVGVEPDPSARAVAQKGGLRVYAGSAESLPSELLADHPAGSFDIVLMRHVLEHCLDPLKALQSARLLLKPDGLLLCETPNNDALGLRFAGHSWNWLDIPRHINFFTRDSLRAACAAAGFRVTEEQYCGYFRQFDRQWIDTEQRIQETLRNGSPKPPAMARAWMLLLSSAFAPRHLKYDSVRLTALAR